MRPEIGRTSMQRDIEKARTVLEESRRLVRNLERFPMRISINGEPVTCTVSPEIIRLIRGLAVQLEEVLAASTTEAGAHSRE